MSVAALGLRFRITTPNSAPRQHLDDACGHIAPRDHRVAAEFVVDEETVQRAWLRHDGERVDLDQHVGPGEG